MIDEKDIVAIEEIIRDRKRAHDILVSRRSRVYNAFLELERATYSDGELSKAQKELIAVAISVVIDCESCMEWHIGQALKARASEEQVLEAVEVAMEMGGGPATVSSRFVIKALEYHRQDQYSKDDYGQKVPRNRRQISGG